MVMHVPRQKTPDSGSHPVGPMKDAKPSRTSLRNYSFGSTAAIVTSVGLIVGFGAATAPRATIVSGLLIVALTDNISDSLSIHIYQESENLESRAALRATLTNFVARLLVGMSFVAIVLLLPLSLVGMASLAWGGLLLAGISRSVAHLRHVSAGREMLEHLVVAIVVIGASRLLAGWIAAHVH
jgi:hypothetical protein